MAAPMVHLLKGQTTNDPWTVAFGGKSASMIHVLVGKGISRGREYDITLCNRAIYGRTIRQRSSVIKLPQCRVCERRLAEKNTTFEDVYDHWKETKREQPHE